MGAESDPMISQLNETPTSTFTIRKAANQPRLNEPQSLAGLMPLKKPSMDPSSAIQRQAIAASLMFEASSTIPSSSI